MTEDEALHNRQESPWHLLAEFLAPGGDSGEDKAVQRISEALWGLDLHSVQRARIEGAVVEALRKAVQPHRRQQHNSPLSIRVWISDLHTAEARSNATARRARPPTHRGWGFFLLERQEDDPHTKAVESHRLVELYLYQETARVK